jgi:GNAT superfamily N-acetyltransferase
MAVASEATEALPCELLEWDSEHFGFPIARVAGESLTPETAEAVDDWCTDHGIRCLYFTADAGDADSALVGASHGYRVVDFRIIARRSLAEPPTPPPVPEGVAFRDATEEDLDRLLELAARSHHGSRFYFDGGFPRERCDALYRAWVERGYRDPSRGLRVPSVDGEPAGYQVLAGLGPEQECHAELIAIDERFRGKGVGSALSADTMRWMAARGALRARATYSARNVGEGRRIPRLGYRTEEVQALHHKWYG